MPVLTKNRRHDNAITQAKILLQERGVAAGDIEKITAESMIVTGTELPTPYGKELKKLYDSFKIANDLVDSQNNELEDYRQDQAKQLIKGNKNSDGAEAYEGFAKKEKDPKVKKQYEEFARDKRIEAARWLSGEYTKP